MAAAKVQFKIESVQPWTWRIYPGMVLQGWLLEGEITSHVRLRLPLKKGGVATAPVICAGLCEESFDADGIAVGLMVNRIDASPTLVYVGLDMTGARCKPEDIDCGLVVESVT